MTQANQIDRERYRGVNEDRSLKQTCGYPVCSNALPDEVTFIQQEKKKTSIQQSIFTFQKPKGQFYIDVRMNKVIDTTERRVCEETKNDENCK